MRVGADQRRQLLDVLNIGEVVELDGIDPRVKFAIVSAPMPGWNTKLSFQGPP